MFIKSCISQGFTLFILWAMSLPASALSQSDIKTMLINEANRQGVSPSLVLAIAKVESDFNPLALSQAGARGVMQIMPATAHKGFNVPSHELYQAEVNIRVGVSYIKQLLEQYQGDVDIALSHYNGGSAVKRSNGDLHIIPATYNYVRKVRQYAEYYQQDGYDEFAPGRTKSVYARAEPKNPGRLSYAQQMALDEQQPIKQSALAKPVGVLNVATTEPRIDNLQQLREHNLTRILGPKPAKLEPGYEQNEQDEHDKAKSDNLVAHNDDEWQLSAANVRSYREVFAETQAPQLSSKQQKVASWEAIFN